MKDRDGNLDDDLREEYDFSGAVRANYAARYTEKVTFHLLTRETPDDPDPEDSDPSGEVAPDVSS